MVTSLPEVNSEMSPPTTEAGRGAKHRGRASRRFSAQDWAVSRGSG